jgi:hypothetical protein
MLPSPVEGEVCLKYILIDEIIILTIDTFYDIIRIIQKGSIK